MGSIILALAWLAFFFAIPGRSYGDALVLHEFTAKEPAPKIEQLLYLAAGVELMRLGLSSTQSGNGESYILLTDFSAKNGTLKIDYTLVRPGAPGQVLATEQATLPIDQSLGERIAGLIRTLMRSAEIPTGPSKSAEIHGLLPRGQTAGAAPGAAVKPDAGSLASGLPPPPVLPASPSHSPAASGSTSIEPTAPQLASQPSRRAVPMRFDSSVSAGSVLFFGQMTQFFHYGVAGLAAAGIVFPGESSTFGLGLDLSFIRVLNDFGVTGGPLYLSTAGLDVRYGTGSRSSIRLSGGLSAGAALVTVASAQKVLAQTAPYGDLGVRAVVALGKSLWLGGELRFLAIYADGLLILGAVPAVTLHIGP